MNNISKTLFNDNEIEEAKEFLTSLILSDSFAKEKYITTSLFSDENIDTLPVELANRYIVEYFSKPYIDFMITLLTLHGEECNYIVIDKNLLLPKINSTIAGLFIEKVIFDQDKTENNPNNIPIIKNREKLVQNEGYIYIHNCKNEKFYRYISKRFRGLYHTKECTCYINILPDSDFNCFDTLIEDICRYY